MVLKMNFMMFLLFINSKTESRESEGGSGRQVSVIIDCNAENIMYKILTGTENVPLFVLWHCFHSEVTIEMLPVEKVKSLNFS